MAGLYISFGPPDQNRARHNLSSLQLFPEETEKLLSTAFFTLTWSGLNNNKYWSPALDKSSGSFVALSGRIGLAANEWESASHFGAIEGGTACRWLLHNFLQAGAEFLERHNGPSLLVAWNASEKKLHVFTDHLGYHPAFLYFPESFERGVVSTSPDAISDDPATNVNIDELSIAEFLSAWRTTPPHTYYHEVKYAGAATHHLWDFKSRKYAKRQYWLPFEDSKFSNIEEAADTLAESLKYSIKIRTLSHLGPIACFSSGGQDSRAVLFSASKDVDLIALNLFDLPNREARIAQDLCVATETRYFGFGRDSEYYPRLMQQNVAGSNGMSSLEDQHYLGTRPVLTALNTETVLTACTTDWVFKGYGLEKQYLKLLGKNLPFQKLIPSRVDSFLPNGRTAISRLFSHGIQERFEDWFEGLPRNLADDQDWLNVEDRRIRPMCYAVSVSGASMYRVFPYDTFLADKTMVDCYSRIKAEWKLNSKVWGMAVRRLSGDAEFIADSGSGAAPGASQLERLVKFGVGWFGRRIKRSEIPVSGIATEGSWPNFSWVIRNSPKLRNVWESADVSTVTLLNELYGRDLWADDLDNWSAHSHDFFRLLTIIHWLERKK